MKRTKTIAIIPRFQDALSEAEDSFPHEVFLKYSNLLEICFPTKDVRGKGADLEWRCL